MAGSAAGMLGCAFGHPLDTLKARLQAGGGGGATARSVVGVAKGVGSATMGGALRFVVHW